MLRRQMPTRRPMPLPPPEEEEPQMMGEPAINPALARVGAGYEPEYQDEEEYSEEEPPNRMAARAAMSGQQPMQAGGQTQMPSRAAMMAQEANETPDQEMAESPEYQAREEQMGVERHHPLGAMARHKKRFSPHERARKMRARY